MSVLSCLRNEFRLERSMTSFWRYNEQTTTWRRPRHPVVAIGDMIAAVCVAIVGFCFAEGVREWLYYGALALLLAVSSIHHWVAESLRLRWADHVMIFVVITFTAIPYLPLLYPAWERVIWLGIMVTLAIGGYMKHRFMGNTWPSLWGYVLSGWPVALLISDQDFWDLFGGAWTFGGICFAAGMCCYAANGIIYASRKPDFFPGLYGYREVQHVALYVAMTLHIAALNM